MHQFPAYATEKKSYSFYEVFWKYTEGYSGECYKSTSFKDLWFLLCISWNALYRT